MIVRILGEGQWDVADEEVTALNELDAAVESAVDGGDRTGRTGLEPGQLGLDVGARGQRSELTVDVVAATAERDLVVEGA